jgi:hypothetical protein
MTALVDFLRRLMSEGSVTLRERPIPSPSPPAEAMRLLAGAYADYRLDVAGPLVDFAADSALAAAALVRQACWFSVNHDEPAQELEKTLTMPGAPASPAQHLSADLLLRYLPHIHRRARALAPADLLTSLLAKVLRQWPLSGVLADIEDGPTIPLDFGGHPGLLLLYAERLAQNRKPAWQPDGVGGEYVELVNREAE